MSTDCENLLRKFLVLNPAKRASLETIMGDKWMNMGFEDDELKPYIEPKQDLADPKRIGKTGTVYKTFSHYLLMLIVLLALQRNFKNSVFSFFKTSNFDFSIYNYIFFTYIYKYLLQFCKISFAFI